jgi:hypothetical protein
MRIPVASVRDLKQNWLSAGAVYQAGRRLKWDWTREAVEAMFEGEFDQQRLIDVERFWVLNDWVLRMERSSKTWL